MLLRVNLFIRRHLSTAGGLLSLCGGPLKESTDWLDMKGCKSCARCVCSYTDTHNLKSIWSKNLAGMRRARTKSWFLTSWAGRWTWTESTSAATYGQTGNSILFCALLVSLRLFFPPSALMTTASPRTHPWDFPRYCWDLMKYFMLLTFLWKHQGKRWPRHCTNPLQLSDFMLILKHVFLLIWSTFLVATNPLFFKEVCPVLPLYLTVLS